MSMILCRVSILFTVINAVVRYEQGPSSDSGFYSMLLYKEFCTLIVTLPRFNTPCMMKTSNRNFYTNAELQLTGT